VRSTRRRCHGDALASRVAAKDVAGKQSKPFSRRAVLVAGYRDFSRDGRRVVADFVGALVEVNRIFRFFDGHGRRTYES